MRELKAWASAPTGNGATGAARRRRGRIASVAITGLVAASLAAATMAPAQAALIGPVGPMDPNGYPVSYSDGPLALGQCLDGPQCLAQIALPNPALPASFPGNMPIEDFFFHAATVPTGVLSLYEAGLEGAYLTTIPANPVPGAPGTVGVVGSEQVFGRVRVLLTGVPVGATYRIQHPYGEFTVTDGGPTDNKGQANGVIGFKVDQGCFAPCTPAGMAAAAANFLGNSANPTSNFLTQANQALPTGLDPRTRIGDILVAGPVGGAPNLDAQGQPLNAVIVTGPNAGGPGINTLRVDQFQVQGALAAGSAAAAPSPIVAPIATNGVSMPNVKWQTPANGGSPVTAYSVQAVDPVTFAPVGAPQASAPVAGTSSNSFDFPGLTPGAKVAFQVTATNAIGTGVASARSATVMAGTQVQRYVARVYYDLFNRAPDPTGMEVWTFRINSNTPRVEVANSITFSTEYRSTLITKSYLTYLARGTDPTGLSGWLAQMRRGITVSQMEGGFIASNEYFGKAGNSNVGWVNKLYTDVLKRPAAPAEVNAWKARMLKGESRRHVAMGFLLSKEHLGTVVDGHYQTLLGRGLDASGRLSTVDLLGRGGRDETIIGGIISSTEYFNKN